MLASAGQPSLHGYDACMVYWAKGALRRNCRLKQRETSFSPSWVFLFSRNPARVGFWDLILLAFHGLGSSTASWANPLLFSMLVLRFHNCWWLAHPWGSWLLEVVGVDFLAVVEHRLMSCQG